MQPIDIKIWDETKNQNRVLLCSAVADQSFRIGRQDSGETNQIGFITSPSGNSTLDEKLVIAFSEEREYSRHLAEIQINHDELEVRNTSNQLIKVGGTGLKPNQSSVVRVPTKINFVDRSIQFENVEAPASEGSLFSLPRPAEMPGLDQFYAPTFSLMAEFSLASTPAEPCIDSERLIELLQTMLQIFQDSPNCQQFFDRASQAMVQLLQLDHVLIAFHEDHVPEFAVDNKKGGAYGKWRFQALQQRTNIMAGEWVPSSNIIRVIETQKETVYQIPEITSESLANVTCLVASPMLDLNDNLLGFIYGDRALSGLSRTLFSEAEAKFVELFANGISVGLQRLEQESKIIEMRSRFDQFFTAELARQLELDETLLEPRSADVSVLFGDIRGFSRISERIGPKLTINWINSVMNALSDCVFQFEGVVVDYIGDEILAMWGAPLDRENHAELAVRAALEMRARLPEISAEWESIIGEPVEIGIGINSGEAQVGNIGSDRKFKYGPLGDVVNVASRVQNATKQLGSQLMVTESTAETLPDDIVHRRIRSVRFVNVQRAINVFEIPLRPDNDWMKLKSDYEAGLSLYERGDLRAASQQLASVINRFPDDGPSVHLLSDSVGSLSKGAEGFDPVWTLDQK